MTNQYLLIKNFRKQHINGPMESDFLTAATKIQVPLPPGVWTYA